MPNDTVLFGLRQVDSPCPHCGSWYRRGAACNICGAHAPVDSESPRAFAQGKPPAGKIWSRKLHRYVRQGEVLSA